jgi:hypothetical protein
MSGVIKAIAAVAAELGKQGISKDRKNQQQGFMFRGIDDVYAALSPLLAANSLVIVPTVMHRECTVGQTKAGAAMYNVVLTVKYTLHHEDGSSVEAVSCGEAMDTGDKATNKAMSAAYKYMAFQTFCIPVTGEEDADATTPAETQPQPRAKVTKFSTYEEAKAALSRVTSDQDLKLWTARVASSKDSLDEVSLDALRAERAQVKEQLDNNPTA